MNTLPPDDPDSLAHSLRSARIDDETLYPSDRLRGILEVMIANWSKGGAIHEAAELIRNELKLRRPKAG